jgi:hypothetical protein
LTKVLAAALALRGSFSGTRRTVGSVPARDPLPRRMTRGFSSSRASSPRGLRRLGHENRVTSCRCPCVRNRRRPCSLRGRFPGATRRGPQPGCWGLSADRETPANRSHLFATSCGFLGTLRASRNASRWRVSSSPRPTTARHRRIRTHVAAPVPDRLASEPRVVPGDRPRLRTHVVGLCSLRRCRICPCSRSTSATSTTR